MAKLLKLRRGTTSQHSSFTGAEGEVTIDTDKDTAVVHDGSTAAGRPLAREDLNNVASASITGRLASGSIATAKIADDAINGDKIADNSITSAHIAADTVVAADIAANSVGTSEIAADAVTGAQIADDAINSEHYVDGSIDTAHIADDAVTNAKIGANAVASNELNDACIGTAKIVDDAVTYAKIQNVSATDRILGRDSSGAGVIEEITPANVRTMINVEDGATADQSAAEILTAIKTVDGAGSGLDADTLDGISSGSFLRSDAADTASGDMVFSSKLSINTTNTNSQLTLNAGSANNALSIRNTEGGNGHVGILFSTQDHSGGREKAAIYHAETHGSAHYGGDIAFCLATSTGSAAQVALSDRKATITRHGGMCFGTDTADANCLDDYEEGTWTLQLKYHNSGTWTNVTFDSNPDNSTGYYTKIGNIVRVNIHTGAFNLNAGPGNLAQIAGLPFVTSNASYNLSVGVLTHVNCFGDPTNTAYSQGGEAAFRPTQNGSTSSSSWADGSKYLIFSATYMI